VSEFWAGVIVSLISALIGAGLTFFITWFFSWRDKNKQKNIIWYVIRKIITDNYGYANYILKQIESEEKILSKENKYPITPFPLLKAGFTKEILFHLPKPLKNDSNLFLCLKAIDFSSQYSNDFIHKINEHKGPLPISNRNDLLKSLNEMLREELLFIIEQIDKYADDIIINIEEMKTLPKETY